MKLKLSQLSHNVIVLMENFEQFTRVYYADGHYELCQQRIKDILPKQQGSSGYKRPVYYENVYLYPSQNQKDRECKWINIDYLDEKDPIFIHLLVHKNLYQKAVHMYLKEKEKLLKDGIVS